LEEELRRQFETITELRAEIKKIQADNLKLYEKVRYLQSYRDDAGSSASMMGISGSNVGGGVGGGSGNGSGGRSISSSRYGRADRKDEDLGKYKNMYEESMNPFEAFRGRERSSAVQMLNPFDKTLFGLASFMLGRRYMRNLFLVYALGLHIFLFFVMYEAAYSSDTERHHSEPIIVHPR